MPGPLRQLRIVAVLAMAGVLLGAPRAGAGAASSPEGEAWQGWRDLITKRFAHAAVSFGVVHRSYLAGGRWRCPKGPFEPPGLFASVSSPNRKVFAQIEISIFEQGEGADGYAYLKRALEQRAVLDASDNFLGETCAHVGNAAVSFIQTGRYWLEIRGYCSDGALYRYEVGEVLALLRERDPSRVPATFGFTACGQGDPTFLVVDVFLEGLKKKKAYWGRSFPDARDEARKRLADHRMR